MSEGQRQGLKAHALLAVGLLCEGFALLALTLGFVALAALGHLVAAPLVALGVAARTPDGEGHSPAILTALAGLFMPPFGVLVGLFAWRSVDPEAHQSALLDELYLELHGRSQAFVAHDKRHMSEAFLDAIDVEPYVDVLRYGDLALRRSAIQRLAQGQGLARVRVLRGALRDADDEIRALAMAALAKAEERLNRDFVGATQGVRDHPQSCDAHEHLGEVLAEFCFLEMADASNRSHYHGLAFRCFARAVELSEEPSRDGNLLISLGKMLLRLGHPQAARDSFELAAQALPDDARPWLWLAEAQFKLGDLEAVQASAAAVLERDPSSLVRDAAAFWIDGAPPKKVDFPAPPRETTQRPHAIRAPAGAGGRIVTPVEVQRVLHGLAQPPAQETRNDEGTRLALLLKDLEGEDAELRRRAFEGLLSCTSDASVETVSSWAREATPILRRLIARYLGRIPSLTAMNELVGLLDDPDPAVRGEAQTALGSFERPVEGTAEVLLRSLRSPSPRARTYSAEALGRLRLERATLSLVDLLADPDSAVRLAAVDALRKLQDGRAARPLVALLNDPLAEVRARVARTLGILAKGLPRELAASARRDESPEVRLVALWAVATLGGREALGVLTEALSLDPDFRARVEACRRLGKLGLRACVRPLVVANARDSDHAVRLAASFALDLIPSRVSCSPLTSTARDPDPQVRFAAISKLGDLQEAPEAALELERILSQDSDPIVRASAAASLGRIGSADVIPALAGALNDSDEAVAYAATLAFVLVLAPEGMQALEGHLAGGQPLSAIQLQAVLRFISNAAAWEELPPALRRLTIESLSAGDGSVRYLAGLALGATRDPEALTPLLEAAGREPMQDIRLELESAASSCCLGDPSPLLEALTNPDPSAVGEQEREVLRSSLRALSQVPPSTPADALAQAQTLLAAGPHLAQLQLLPEEQAAYVDCFAHRPESLIEIVETESARALCLPALKMITTLAGRGLRVEALEPLRALVDDPDEFLAAEAIAALGALGDASLFRTLVYLALRDPDEQGGPSAAARESVRRLVSAEVATPVQGGARA